MNHGHKKQRRPRGWDWDEYFDRFRVPYVCVCCVAASLVLLLSKELGENEEKMVIVENNKIYVCYFT